MDVQTGVPVPPVVQVVLPEVGVVPVARPSHPTGHLPISLLRMRLCTNETAAYPLSEIEQRGATDLLEVGAGDEQRTLRHTQTRRRNVTVLQPGWYEMVRSGMDAAAAAESSA